MKRKIDTFWYWFLVIVSFVVCYMFTCATKTKAVSSNYFYEKGNSYGLIYSGQYIYNFKGTTYYFNYNLENYTFNPEDGKWTYINITNSTSVSGDYVWDDGQNLYYSSGTSQKVLNFNTMSWENKVWNGLNNFAGNKIWSDGTNIYCSNGTSGHYILDKETSTWNTHTWPGYYGFTGQNIWKDARGRIFSLSGSNFYKLNDDKTEFVRITTSTGLSNGNAMYIWTDGTNVYHSNASTHHIFDHDNLKWTTKGFLGNPYFYGSAIWHDNLGGIYHTNTYTTLKFDYEPSNNGSGYTEEDLNAKYNEGFEAGKNSVDITSDNEEYANAVVNELMIQFDMIMQSLENEWNATLEYINEKVGFITEEDIFNIWDMTQGGLIEEPSYKTEYYLTKLTARWNVWLEEVKATVDITSNDSQVIQDYITNNNYHTNTDYLNYGNQKYQEGQNSVDITSDNEAYAEQVIENKLKNHQLFDPEYVFNVIQNAEDKFYADGYKDGQESIDITSNDAEAIQNYITNNNYHTHTDYLNYGNQKYIEGQNSIDITSNDEQIYNNGFNDGKNSVDITKNEEYINLLNRYGEIYNAYNNYMILVNENINFTTENDILNKIFGSTNDRMIYFNNLTNNRFNIYNQELFNDGKNSVDITSNDDEVYNNGFNDGKNEGYNYLLNSIIGSFKNNSYESAGNYIEQEKMLMTEENINIFDSFKNVDLINQDAILNSMLKVKDIGYVEALNDSDAFLGLIPTTLGAVVSNMMPILTYEVYGISLMNIIGLIAIIGVAIIVVKFMVG